MVGEVLLVVLGLLTGSFLSAFVDRLQDGRKWVVARSQCDSCKTHLGSLDLLPVISWTISRGKCRHCKKPIGWRYPVIELTTAGLFMISYIFWPDPLVAFEIVKFGLWLVFLAGFVALSIYDLRWCLLPNKIVYSLIGLAMLGLAAEIILTDSGFSSIIGAGAGVLGCAGLFYVLFWMSKGRWIGGGDVKLGILLGILAGGIVESLILVLIASILGLLVSLPLFINKKLNLKSQLPFGPLLMAATVIMVIFGGSLLDWYLNLAFSY